MEFFNFCSQLEKGVMKMPPLVVTDTDMKSDFLVSVRKCIYVFVKKHCHFLIDIKFSVQLVLCPAIRLLNLIESQKWSINAWKDYFALSWINPRVNSKHDITIQRGKSFSTMVPWNWMPVCYPCWPFQCIILNKGSLFSFSVKSFYCQFKIAIYQLRK